MKGRENLAGSMPDGHETVDCRTGDGLSVLAPAEVDVIVIAGMGGRLIRQIMEADIALTRSFAKFILQRGRSRENCDAGCWKTFCNNT